MKMETFVVSSYEISPSAAAKGGFIRVGQADTKQNKVYTMDEAIAKLKKVLREMKNQDRDIYQQLMTLNTNITRLKKEIRGEEEKKRHNEMEPEYDYDSIDSEDDSGSDFDISDIEMDDQRCKADSSQSSGIESGELKEGDSDSIHERFDSGIQEDASYNLSSNDSMSSMPGRPKRKDTSMNGERSAMYNFLLTKLQGSEESQGNSENEELLHKNGKEDRSKRGAISGEKRAKSLELESDEKVFDAETRSKSGDMDGKIIAIKAASNEEIPEFVLGGETSKREKKVAEEDDLFLKRSNTLQPRKMTKVQAKRIIMHRRTQSEDRTMLDLNANYRNANEDHRATQPSSARDGYTKRNLEHISEFDGSATWNAFDARNYRGSERAIRREIMPIKSIRINQVTRKQEESGAKLKGSLTNLNLEGAISSSAIKAIRRSSSSQNCAALYEGGGSTVDFSRSWSMPRKKYDDKAASDSGRLRLQKTTSTYIPSEEELSQLSSGYEVAYLTYPNGMVSSTISLV